MITIASVGDLILDEPDPASFLAPAAPLLRAADVTIGHVEVPHSTTTVSQSTDVPAPPADPAALPALTDAGFDIVTLAGNHIHDAGDVGIADTVAHARAAGLVPTGAGATLAEARTPAVVERGGLRVGVLSYNCVGPGSHGQRRARPGVPTYTC
ncbi:CapA family protein [Prauserella oleivorans]